MQITLIAIGKTDKSELEELIAIYEKRLKHYIKFQMEVIPDIKNRKNLSEAQQKDKEGELILTQLQPTDTLILLDEKGKQYTSVDFAQFLQKKMNSGIKNLVLAIGGPYGFSDAVYAKSSGKPHPLQEVLLFLELTQEYRIKSYGRHHQRPLLRHWQ